VELQHLRSHSLQHLPDVAGARVDEKGNRSQECRGRPVQLARALERQKARARRVEDEAESVGARVRGCVQILVPRNPADLDARSHASIGSAMFPRAVFRQLPRGSVVDRFEIKDLGPNVAAARPRSRERSTSSTQPGSRAPLAYMDQRADDVAHHVVKERIRTQDEVDPLAALLERELVNCADRRLRLALRRAECGKSRARRADGAPRRSSPRRRAGHASSPRIALPAPDVPRG
jgi:hypothetical protein